MSSLSSFSDAGVMNQFCWPCNQAKQDIVKIIVLILIDILINVMKEDLKMKFPLEYNRFRKEFLKIFSLLARLSYDEYISNLQRTLLREYYLNARLFTYIHIYIYMYMYTRTVLLRFTSCWIWNFFLVGR